MFPAWAILLYAAAVLVLLIVIGLMVWREARVWRISKTEIEAAALLLLSQHGPNSDSVAMKREMDAWTNGDHQEEGRWRRVRQHLLKSGRKPPGDF